MGLLNSNFISNVTGSLIGGVVAFKIAKFEIERHEKAREKEKKQEFISTMNRLSRTVDSLQNIDFSTQIALANNGVSRDVIISKFEEIKEVYNDICDYRSLLVPYVSTLNQKDITILKEDWDEAFKEYNQIRTTCESINASFVGINKINGISQTKYQLNKFLVKYVNKLQESSGE